MKLRHDLIVLTPQAVVLRRTLPDGKRLLWCGRDYGWQTMTGYFYCHGVPPKCYSGRGFARNALTSILRHERELGLAGRYYVVAD